LEPGTRVGFELPKCWPILSCDCEHPRRCASARPQLPVLENAGEFLEAKTPGCCGSDEIVSGDTDQVQMVSLTECTSGIRDHSIFHSIKLSASSD
jgi:hypothetical protein